MLKNLVEVCAFLKDNGFHFEGYRSKTVTLSAEGYIKLYIVNSGSNIGILYLKAGIKNNSYFEVLQDRNNIWEYLPLPP